MYCAIYKTYKGGCFLLVSGLALIYNGSNFKSDDRILLKQRFADYTVIENCDCG